MLVAQSQIEGLTFVTADDAIASYARGDRRAREITSAVRLRDRLVAVRPVALG